MQISSIPMGGVIVINGQKFVKVLQDTEKGSQFLSVPHAPVCALGATDTMQAWTVADCNALVTPTATNFTQGPCLSDERDGKKYEIRKFADGKCWMVDNLAYGGEVDACANKTTFDGCGDNGVCSGASKSGSAWGYGDCRSNRGDPAYGYLYNWQGVMQHPFVYHNNFFQPPEPAQGICPPGWHVPSGGTTGEYQALHTAAGSPTTGFWQKGAWKVVYAGVCSSSGSLSGQGSRGDLWSSTQNSASDVRILQLNSSAMSLVYLSSKTPGFPVRCIKDTTERTMQNFTTADCDAYPTPSGTDYTPVGQLKDERDGKWYEIRKFADGKCWMVDNLAYGGTTDACASKTTFSGNGSATPTNIFGTGTYGDCRNNPGSSTYGYLYNWQAAMQHASAYWSTNYTGPATNVQGICPQGWHIPTGNTSGEYQALHTATGSPTTGFWQNTGSWKGVFSGGCISAGGLVNQGSNGNHWSSTQYSTYGAYRLLFDASGVDPASSVSKLSGLTVRCVKN